MGGELKPLKPPLNLQNHNSVSSGLKADQLKVLHNVAGLAWVAGALVFGYLTVNRPKTCRISKSNLCQTSLVFIAMSTAFMPVTRSTEGYAVNLAVYAFFLSGYSFTLKTLYLDMCKTRHFGFVYSLSNLVQAVGVSMGVPLAVFLDGWGFYLTASLSGLGASTLFVSDLYLKFLNRKKATRRRQSEGHEANCPQRLLEDKRCSHETLNDEDEEGDEDEDLPKSWIDIYHRRFSSPAAMMEWQKLEALLFADEAGQQAPNPVVSAAPRPLLSPQDDASMAPNMVENRLVVSEYEQNLLKAKEELSFQCPAEVPPKQLRHWNHLPRQTSEVDSMCYSSSDRTSSGTSSSGASLPPLSMSALMAGPNNMLGISASAAALSAAMLTASATVNPKECKPRYRHHPAGIRYQRSITTVIEEVSPS